MSDQRRVASDECAGFAGVLRAIETLESCVLSHAFCVSPDTTTGSCGNRPLHTVSTRE